MLRLAKILWIASRFGLDEFALDSGSRWARVFNALFFFRTLSEPRGVRLRRALETLGPIFVKFGQVLSTRRDLLPQDIADELAKLQDQVPPFPGELAVAEVERALGKPLLVENFANIREDVWDYRFLDGTTRRFGAEVHFHAGGAVKYVVTYPDSCPWAAVACP